MEAGDEVVARRHLLAVENAKALSWKPYALLKIKIKTYTPLTQNMHSSDALFITLSQSLVKNTCDSSKIIINRQHGSGKYCRSFEHFSSL